MAARNGFVIALFVVMMGTLTAWGQPLDTLWARTIDVPGTGQLNTVIATADGGFLLGGVCNFNPGVLDPRHPVPAVGDICVVKTDSLGNQQWTNVLSVGTYDVCWQLHQAGSDGYLAVAGVGRDIHGGTEVGYWDHQFVKLNLDGVVVWSRLYPGSTVGKYSTIEETGDGDFLITISYSDASLLRISSQGDTLWSRLLGRSSDWIISRLIVSEPDSATLVLSTLESGTSYDLQLKRFSSQGDSLSDHRAALDSMAGYNSFLKLRNGGYLLCGDKVTGLYQRSAYLTKTSSAGDILWNRTANTPQETQLYGALETPDHSFIGIGTMRDSGGSYSPWIARFDSAGWLGWNWQLGPYGSPLYLQCAIPIAAPDSAFILFGTNAADFWMARLGNPSNSGKNGGWAIRTEQLHPNYPNPFNPTTEIAFDLPKSEHVSLKAFEVLGRQVMTLANGRMEAGTHRVTFDGSGLPSGIYVYRLQAGEYTESRKMVLLK